jgi:fructoselysine-6-P-deglycase FrlB-like protein
MTEGGTHLAAEIRTQPDDWRGAGELAREHRSLLPAPGERVAVIGCGTSLYMAQAFAELREAAGLGVTDAWPASENRLERGYDRVVAITRSGTTTEVIDVLERWRGRVPLTVVTATAGSPVLDLADSILLPHLDEQSVVQTRFATTALALLRELADRGSAARAADAGERALADPLPVEPAGVEQWTFLGRGWTVGLAHEAALKLRESAQAWTESYPAFEYRHGPISIAAPGRVVWSHGPLDAAIAAAVRATGATLVVPELDPLASLVLAQRTAVAAAEARGLDPDRPRNLTRSVVLSGDELEVLA